MLLYVTYHQTTYHYYIIYKSNSTDNHICDNTWLAMSYSDLSKRRRIRDINIQDITSDTLCKAVSKEERFNWDQYITASSTSTKFSESTERSLHSLQANEDDSLPTNQHIKINKSSLLHKFQSKKVTFSTVEIRQYAVIMADYQDCCYPISLDWGHTKSYVMHIDEFDVSRVSGARPLDAKERLKRLQTMGFRSIELQSRERSRRMRVLQDSRRETKFDGVLMSPYIEAMGCNLAPSKY
jgi:hypothetical protein